MSFMVYTNRKYQTAKVRKDKGIPIPTINEANLELSPWLMAMIEPEIMGAMPDSITLT